VLRDLGIGINDAANGVFLGKVHSAIHTGDYYGAVEQALTGAKTKAEAEQILRNIGNALKSGKFP
jgi:hypothetical protein